MEWGGRRRRRGQGRVGAVVIIALVSAVPELVDTAPEARIRPPAVLEPEDVYPNPMRTALELEVRYQPRPSAPVLAGRVALTFDTEIPNGGEAQQTVNEVLDVLRQANVRATFFVVGTWARANGDVLRRMADDGHEIANHSFDHRPYAGRRVGDLQGDLDSVAALVAAETGAAIAPLFRPPYGCLDATAARVVEAAGYALAGWTAAGADARGDTAGPLEVVREIERDLAPGAVILLHTNRWITAAALPLLLDAVGDQGLDVVPLSELIAADEDARTEVARRAVRRCGRVGRLVAAL